MINLKVSFNRWLQMKHGQELQVLYIFNQPYNIKTLIHSFLSFFKQICHCIVDWKPFIKHFVPLHHEEKLCHLQSA